MARLDVPIARRKDKRVGVIGAIVYVLLVLFLLFFLTYTEPDPPKVTVPVPIEMSEEGLDNFEVDNGGGGAPNETPETTSEPEETATEQPTQEESPVQTETGQDNAESSSQTTDESAPANPFSGSSSGGSGTSGTGTGFGSDDGPGTGSGNPGTGAGGDRVRMNNLTSQPKTPNDENSRIAYKLVVDAQGKILRADVIRSNTTTSNQRLIDEVTELVKKEVKYKAKPGARNETVYYSVTVRPQ